MSSYRRSFTVLAAAIVTLSGPVLTASADEPAQQAAIDRPAVDQPEPVARGLIVKTTTSTPSEALLDATDKALGDEAEVVDDDKLLTRVSTVGFDQQVPTSVALEAATEIEKRSDVVWATPDSLRRTQASPVKPNDPMFPSQRNLWDSTYTSPAGGYSIKAPAVWPVTKGRSDVTVAVLDTGITHNPEIAPSLVPGYDMVTDEFMSRDGDGRDSNPDDPGDWAGSGQCYSKSPGVRSSWHGTFVAGQIAANTDDRVGLAGVAPGVKVMPVRVLGRCGGFDSDIIAGIRWASGGHVEGVPDLAPADWAEVVNLSLGSLERDAQSRAAACLPYAEAAAEGNSRKTFFVASAGNEGASADLAVPSSCGRFFSVGATSLRGFRAAYSNFGRSVDISAPGGDSLVEGYYDSVLGLGNTGTTSPKSPKYVRYEGTSMAAPQVSAAAALIFSFIKDRDLDREPYDRLRDIEAGLRLASAPFRKRVSSYDNRIVKVDGRYYQVGYLNCAPISSGDSRCGAGLLDLSRLELAIGQPQIIGDLAIGEPLTVRASWVREPSDVQYYWRREGSTSTIGDRAIYHPVRADVGKTLTVIVRVNSWVGYSTFSAPSAPVPDGPEVALSGLPATTIHGAPGVGATVSVSGAGAGGVVELRRGSKTLASGETNSSGVATIEVPGVMWTAGTNRVRATFLGSGARPLASSPEGFVEVDKALPAVTTSLISVVKRTSNAKLKVTVKVIGDPHPYGGFKVFDGSKRIATSHIYASGDGTRTILLPKLKAGRHQIRVYYFGNDNIHRRYSAFESIVSK